MKSRSDRAATLRLAAIAVAAVVLTFASVRFGQQLRSDGISVFWPAAGVLTCFIVFTEGYNRAAAFLGVCLGSALGNLFGDRSFSIFLLFLMGNLAYPFLILTLRAKAGDGFPFFGSGRRHRMTRDAMAFGIQALIAVLIVGAILAPCLRWAGVTQGSFLAVWGQWLLSNLGGIAVVSPLAFLLMAWLENPVESRTFANAIALDLPWTIRQRLIVLVAVLAIPMLLLIVGAVAYFAQLARDNQYKSLEFATRSIAQAVDARLSQYIILAKTLAQSPALLEDDLSAFGTEASRAFPNPDKTWVVVSDANFRQLLNQHSQLAVSLPERSEPSRVTQAKAFESNSVQVSNAHFGTVSKVMVTTVEVPVFLNGRPFRCLTITMDLDEFFKLLSEKELPRGWVAGIADGQGRYVARVPDNTKRVGQSISTGWKAILRQEGIAEIKTIEGDPVINANVNSKLSDWTIALGAKKSVIEAPAFQTVRWAILLGVGTSVLCLMFAAWVARSIIDPVEKLGVSARSLVSGAAAEYATKLPEAAQLWKTLQSAVREREQTFNALLRSEAEAQARSEEIQTLYQSSPIGLGVLDLNACFIRVNDAMADITGHSAQKHLGQTVWDVAPSLEEAAKLNVAKVSETADAILDVEWSVKPMGADGLRRVWVASFYPLKASGGAVNAVGMTLRDITAERQATEQIKLLIDEVNHRSKNLLAVVQSVAYHTAKDGDPSVFAQRLMDRIMGLAKSQDLLVDNNWQNVDLRELLKRQLIHFKDAFGRRIHFRGPTVQLTAAATQTLGMAFNELATNAAKYGALSDDRGMICVEWYMKVNGSAPTLHLKWTEAEGPEVRQPTRRGFGHTVLVRMVEQSLEADVYLHYNKTGVVWEMTAPAVEVLSRFKEASSPSLNADEMMPTAGHASDTPTSVSSSSARHHE